VDYATCTKVQDKMWRQNSEGAERGREKAFTIARGSKIAHAFSFETIEHRRMKKWRGAA
jgi:hypothetical protein